jgi:SAM-dependent methyltransferase
MGRQFSKRMEAPWAYVGLDSSPVTRLDSLRERLYPGEKTLGVSARNGTVRFYVSVNRLMPTDCTVLDFGAGRGARLEAERDPWMRQLLLLRPKCSKRLGCDVDSEVMDNRFLDDAYVLDATDDHRIPMEGESVDLVLADWVIEHLERPASAFREIHRVLRPGGWFCARTGNVRHYAYALARLLSSRAVERQVLARVVPAREERDVFPKLFRANTRPALRDALESAGFDEVLIHHWEPEPGYLSFHPVPLLLGALYERIASMGLLPAAHLLAFARKQGGG